MNLLTLTEILAKGRFRLLTIGYIVRNLPQRYLNTSVVVLILKEALKYVVQKGTRIMRTHTTVRLKIGTQVMKTQATVKSRIGL